MSHRAELNTMSASDRQALVDLMLAYLNDDIVDDHMMIIHSGLEIFTGHRAYFGAMEAWLNANGGSAYVPLPMWNSADPIPPEFNVVKPEDDGTARPSLVNLNPGIPKPPQYEPPAVCDFEDPADLGDAINGWHGSVHCAIGGTMCNIMIASAAPIFWCWHAFVDHIYWDWQQCSVTCPNTVGDTLGWATQKLRVAGLKLGGVARIPHFILERPPFRLPIPLPDPPPFLPKPFRMRHDEPAATHDHEHVADEERPEFSRTPAEFGHSVRAPAAFARLLRGPRVIAQSVSSGRQIRRGRTVDLTVLSEED